jgi:hypothetical protein
MRKIPARPTPSQRRIRVPLPRSSDLRAEQRRNLDMARRRLGNCEEKLNTVRYLLNDLPDDISPSVRQEVWLAQQAVAQIKAKLVLKRGRKPAARPRPTPLHRAGRPHDETTGTSA